MLAVTWHEGEDVEQYLAAAGDLMLGQPGLFTISLTVAANVRARPDGTRFAWWQEESGDVTGCVSLTPPYPVAVGVLPEAAMAPLLDLWDVPGVNAPTTTAVQLASLAARRTGRTPVVRNAMRLFRLGELVVPDAPGRGRLCTESDEELLVEAFSAFIEETGVIPQDVRASVRDRISHQGFLVWEDDEPVAVAGCSRNAFQAVRIGPVYTWPQARGRGYGSAVTAAASERAAAIGGWEVVLFTDLTNPTSNALYPRLGYQPVQDRAVVLLSA